MPANTTYTEIVTTTLENRSRIIADNVSNSNALLMKISERGNVKPADGGRTIVQELDYAENATFMYYSGYEAWSLTPSDVISAAEFEWKQAVVVVSMSGLEIEVQNSGPSAVKSLIDARVTNAERTMRNKISEGVYSDGTGSAGKQITGLQATVADANTTGFTGVGTVGGINASTSSFWANFVYDSSATNGAAMSATNILQSMQRTYINLTRGADHPDIAVADGNYYGFFWNSLTAIQRINAPGEGKAGFDALKFAGADVYYDGDSGLPANHMYMLNTNYLFWRPHPARNMVPLRSRDSLNQDATIVPLVFAGNLTCSNRALQGVLKE
jgi:hypothetical protein